MSELHIDHDARTPWWRVPHEWFFGTVPVAPLALCRIGIGTVMFLAYWTYAPAMEELYGEHGFVRYFRGGEPTWLMSNLWLMWTLTMVSAAAFATGTVTRVSGVVLAYCQVSWVNTTMLHTWGWAATIASFIVYVTLSQSHARYSVDAWFRRRVLKLEPLASEVPAWPMRLIFVHILAVYLAAGWHRVDNASWLRGEVVFIAVTDSTFSRFPLYDFQVWKPVLWLACWFAWTLELGAPVMLCIRGRVRTLWALGLQAMHLGLEATSIVGWWQWMMFIMLFTCLPPAWSAAVLEAPRRMATTPPAQALRNRLRVRTTRFAVRVSRGSSGRHRWGAMACRRAYAKVDVVSEPAASTAAVGARSRVTGIRKKSHRLVSPRALFTLPERRR